MAAPSSPHVLIIGGGLVGSMLAHGLAQAGVRFSIFEKDQDLKTRAREWTLAIHWAMPELEKLLPKDLYDRLTEAQSNPFIDYSKIGSTAAAYNGTTGELLREINVPGMKRLSRTRLRALCSERLDIQYNKAFVKATFDDEANTVTAHFADGTQATGDVLIGTDGGRSPTRLQVFGKEAGEPKDMDVVIRMADSIKYHDAEIARQVKRGQYVTTVAYSPKGYIFMINPRNIRDQSDPLTWEFHIFISWLGDLDPNQTNQEALDELRAIGEKFCEPFRTALVNLPDDTAVYSSKGSYWTPSAWDDKAGRITFAGDAAHPMPPFRGQGLQNGIADATFLVRTLKEVSEGTQTLAKGIAAYNEEMVARASKEMTLSIENTYMVHDWSKLDKSPLAVLGIKKE